MGELVMRILRYASKYLWVRGPYIQSVDDKTKISKFIGRALFLIYSHCSDAILAVEFSWYITGLRLFKSNLMPHTKDTIHKSTIYHSKQKCARSVLNGTLWDSGQEHCVIYEIIPDSFAHRFYVCCLAMRGVMAKFSSSGITNISCP